MVTGEGTPEISALEQTEQAVLPYTRIIEQERLANEQKTIESAVATFVGRLELGEGKITSQLETADEISEKLETVKDCLRAVEDRKCAVCIDGRGACCSAADVISVNPDGSVEYESKKPKIRAKVPGGLYFYLTVAAIGADLEIVRGATTFEEAKQRIAEKLDAEGYRDGAHTTTLSFSDPTRTECGAQDGIGGSSETAVQRDEESAVSGVANGIDHAVAALSGTDKTTMRQDVRYEKVRDNVAQRQKAGFFAGYNAVESRDQIAKNDPYTLELLESDRDHPTSLHEEDLLIVNTIPGYTVDRDEYKERTGRGVFVLDIWMLNNDIAPLLTNSSEEAESLRIAGDYASAFKFNRLVSKNFPVAVISDSRLAPAA